MARLNAQWRFMSVKCSHEPACIVVSGEVRLWSVGVQREAGSLNRKQGGAGKLIKGGTARDLRLKYQ